MLVFVRACVFHALLTPPTYSPRSSITTIRIDPHQAEIDRELKRTPSFTSAAIAFGVSSPTKKTSSSSSSSHKKHQRTVKKKEEEEEQEEDEEEGDVEEEDEEDEHEEEDIFEEDEPKKKRSKLNTDSERIARMDAALVTHVRTIRNVRIFTMIALCALLLTVCVDEGVDAARNSHEGCDNAQEITGTSAICAIYTSL